MYTPKELRRWELPSHYFGAKWPEYYSSGFGQSRDSDALERSNFICALKALGGESETIIVVRESHWAVGWVEWIAIHQSDEKALRAGDELREAYDQYPVVNEDHWSQLENEDAQQTWTNCFSDSDRLDYIRSHRSQFEFHDMADLIANVRGRYFSGYASELLA